MLSCCYICVLKWSIVSLQKFLNYHCQKTELVLFYSEILMKLGFVPWLFVQCKISPSVFLSSKQLWIQILFRLVVFCFINSAIINNSIFWDIMPRSSLEVNRRFGGAYYPRPRRIRALSATCFVLVSCLAYSSTQKMRVICSSETSDVFRQSTWCYVPGDGTLYNHRCENLKCYTMLS
jgi:hypothetical protein